LILFKTIKQLMPIFVCNRIVQHELGPGSCCEITRTFAIICEISLKNDFEARCAHEAASRSVSLGLHSASYVPPNAATGGVVRRFVDYTPAHLRTSREAVPETVARP